MRRILAGIALTAAVSGAASTANAAWSDAKDIKTTPAEFEAWIKQKTADAAERERLDPECRRMFVDNGERIACLLREQLKEMRKGKR
jgi:hypothetical protein